MKPNLLGFSITLFIVCLAWARPTILLKLFGLDGLLGLLGRVLVDR